MSSCTTTTNAANGKAQVLELPGTSQNPTKMVLSFGNNGAPAASMSSGSMVSASSGAASAPAGHAQGKRELEKEKSSTISTDSSSNSGGSQHVNSHHSSTGSKLSKVSMTFAP